MRRRIAPLLGIALAALQLAAAAAPPSQAAVEPWSGKRAMEDIEALLRFTPRSPGAPGHEQAIAYITDELAKTPAKAVTLQRWAYYPDDDAQIALTNIIGRTDPANPRRIIVATHYDSIVRAYRDKRHPEAPMPGANNSASGVALLLETARVLQGLPTLAFGVDFVFFDGEEGPKSLGAGDPQWKALGSPHFARSLSELYPAGAPLKAIVFDMVCDRDLVLQPDKSSMSYAPAETTKFWAIGGDIAPSRFVRAMRDAAINDDHTALANAGIPSFLIIDFDYEPWFNTTEDTIDKCSASSLEAVGRTLVRYLHTP